MVHNPLSPPLKAKIIDLSKVLVFLMGYFLCFSHIYKNIVNVFFASRKFGYKYLFPNECLL